MRHQLWVLSKLPRVWRPELLKPSSVPLVGWKEPGVDAQCTRAPRGRHIIAPRSARRLPNWRPDPLHCTVSRQVAPLPRGSVETRGGLCGAHIAASPSPQNANQYKPRYKTVHLAAFSVARPQAGAPWCIQLRFAAVMTHSPRWHSQSLQTGFPSAFTLPSLFTSGPPVPPTLFELVNRTSQASSQRGPIVQLTASQVCDAATETDCQQVQ